MKSSWVFVPLSVLAIIIIGLVIWRFIDLRADAKARSSLLTGAGVDIAVFNPALVAGLPEPAQRYFKYSIADGAPLYRTVEFNMDGVMGLGTKTDPNYQPINAQQILAPPHGFVWQLKAGLISGSDGATAQTSWTRFWLFNLIPVVRVSGPDHQRSAFGRTVSEGAFLVPASLLPSETVRWEPVSADTARAIVQFGDFTQAVDLTVSSEGAATRVIIQRWSNENVDKVFREQPFGGYLYDHKQIDGYRIPTRFEGGNHIGTDDFFPFIKARLTEVEFR